MQLVIAEKPSVGVALAKALDVTDKKDGYIEGNGYIVSWCVGHLVSLANADMYDEKFKKWDIADLPIIPDEWQFIIAEDKDKQFGILRQLMDDSRVTEVVNACDAGREGELIFRLVYNKALCNKPIKRLLSGSGFPQWKKRLSVTALIISVTARTTKTSISQLFVVQRQIGLWVSMPQDFSPSSTTER